MNWYDNKKIIIRRIYVFILLFGIDLKKILNLFSFTRYLKDYFKFKKKGGKVRNIYISLEDFNNEASEFKNQFFHSDLVVSQKIFNQNPKNHLDIGSRIDGLVSHIASYRSLDFADIRNVKIYPHKNINTQQIDIGNENLKITVRFLSNEIRADALDLKIFYKNCDSSNKCKISEKEGVLVKELKKEILKKAAIYQQQTKTKKDK